MSLWPKNQFRSPENPSNYDSYQPFSSEEHRQSLGKRADIVFGPDPFDPRMDSDTDPAMDAIHDEIAAGRLPPTYIEDLEKTVGEFYGTSDPDELQQLIREDDNWIGEVDEN